MSEHIYELQAAQALLKKQHAQGWEALNNLFRSGSVPSPPPSGRYAGRFIAMDFAPGLTQALEWLAGLWMPWLGKTFQPADQRGDNILTKASYPLARLFAPLYRDYAADQQGTYRAFAFHTYLAPGLLDPDRVVLKIDYNLNENPPLTVRRVLDELVELADDFYLGKAHVHWGWRPGHGWKTFAYFTLTK
jgi:hypothetical protein